MRWSLLFMLGFVACDSKPNTQEIPKADVGGFFSEAILDETATGDDATVPCVGTSEALHLEDVRALRGTVVAPPKTTASRFSLIRSAHAVPVDGEVPKPNVEITLGVGEKVWQQTTTDPLGRFCFFVKKSLSAETILTADIDGTPLRRFAPTTHIAVVSAQTEAVYQIASPFQPLTKGEVMNLQTMADTRTDLYYQSGIEGGITAAVTRIKADLEKDPRVRAWLQRRVSAQKK